VTLLVTLALSFSSSKSIFSKDIKIKTKTIL